MPRAWGPQTFSANQRAPHLTVCASAIIGLLMSENEIQIAKDALQGAMEMIKAGTLFVKGVQIKAIHRGNVMAVFPPGVREVVRRFMRGY